jgi:SAM-dependent methyltransferase
VRLAVALEREMRRCGSAGDRVQNGPMSDGFYGPEQARIHHEAFGRLADRAADRLLAELGASGIRSGTFVDLGCGTGILARRMLDAGFDVLGADISPSMLAIARAEAPGARLVEASLLDLDLPPCVAVAATGEALNYATDPRMGATALAGVVRRVRRALESRGVFAFDVSLHGRSGPDRRRVQFHDGPDWSVGVVEIEDEVSVTRTITTFRRASNGEYARTDEVHRLWLCDADELLALLGSSGFQAQRFEDYTGSDGMVGWTVVIARVS